MLKAKAHLLSVWHSHKTFFLWCTFHHCWSNATCSKHNIQAWQCHAECFNLCGSRTTLKLATRSGCFPAKGLCAVFKQLSLVITHQYRSKVLIKAGFIPFIQPSLLSQLNRTTLGNEQVCFVGYKLKSNSSCCMERAFMRRKLLCLLKNSTEVSSEQESPFCKLCVFTLDCVLACHGKCRMRREVSRKPLNSIFYGMANKVICSSGNPALWEGIVWMLGNKAHISFWDADSFCPVFLQVLYMTYSLDISLKYA